MSRAVHWLQCVRLLFNIEWEHVLTIMLPVARRLPHLTVVYVWRYHLLEATFSVLFLQIPTEQTLFFRFRSSWVSILIKLSTFSLLVSDLHAKGGWLSVGLATPLCKIKTSSRIVYTIHHRFNPGVNQALSASILPHSHKPGTIGIYTPTESQTGHYRHLYSHRVTG